MSKTDVQIALFLLMEGDVDPELIPDLVEPVKQLMADSWEESSTATAEWIERCGRPADIGPPDPPLNPYEED